MDKRNIACRAVKRRRPNSKPHQSQLRKKVYLSDDTWLETLKYLTCSKWSQKCFVSRQINGVAQRNILRLPMMTLDSATMCYHYSVIDYWRNTRSKQFNNYTTVAFDTVMQQDQSAQWFKNRGFTLDALKDIPVQNAVIGVTKYSSQCNINVCIYGSAQNKIPLSEKEQRLPWYTCNADERKPVLFHAQYNPLFNRYSSEYLSQFLKCIYHPVTYIKEVKMYAVKQSFIDSLKCNTDSSGNEPRYIRCESFVLKGMLDADIAVLSNLLEWLGRNVRAEKIEIPRIIFNVEEDHQSCILLSNFLLETSGANQCAFKKTKIRVSNSVAFLKVLIEKFRTIPVIESALPTIEFYYPRAEEFRVHLGQNLIAREVDSQGADALYMIQNGQNNMRISFNNQSTYVRNNMCNVYIYSI